MGNAYDDTLAEIEGDQTPTIPNVYAQTIEEQDRGAATRLRMSLRGAADTTPDAAAEARRLSLRFGVPPDVIQRDLPTWRTRGRVEDPAAVNLPRTAPKTAAWLEQPENAALASDDVDGLRKLEHAVTFGESVKRGIDQIEGLGYSAAEATGQLVRAKGLEAWGRAGRIRETAEQAAVPTAQFFTIRSPDEFAQWVKESVGTQIPIMGSMIASGYTGAAIGSVVGAAGTAIGGLIGAMIPAFVYGVGEVQQTIKQIDPDADVPIWAFIGGSAVGAFDTILPGKIGSRLVRTFGKETAEAIARRVLLAPAKASFLRGAAGGFATEGFTEALQEAIGNVAAAIGTDTSVDWPSTWRQMVEAGAAGALLGGISSVSEVGVERLHDRRRVVAAQQQSAVFDALAKGALDSKLVKRLPEAAQAFLAHATKDGPLELVYTPTDTWTTYWQSHGVDPAAVAAELTGNPTALEDAVAAGGNLAIPTAAYAVKVAPTEHHQFFAGELRLSPDAMNAREAAAFEAEERQAGPGTAPSGGYPLAAVVEAVRAQLAPLGFDESAIQAYAALYDAFVGRQAQRASGGAVQVDPVALFQRYGLQVTRPDLAQLIPSVPPTGEPVAVAGAEGAVAGALPLEPAGPAGLAPEFQAAGLGTPGVPAAAPAAGVLTSAQQQLLDIRLQLAEEAAASRGETLTDVERAEIRAQVTEPVAPGAEAAMAAGTARVRGRAGVTPVTPVTPAPGTVAPTIDTGLAPAETTTDVLTRAGQAGEGAGPAGPPAVRSVEASYPPGREVTRTDKRTGRVRRTVRAVAESADQLAARRQAHYDDVFASLLDAAQALDPTVDPVRLRQEVDGRIGLLEDLDTEFRETGGDLTTLLKRIAEYGGISLEAEEGGYAGELRVIRESAAMGPFGTFAGVPGVFRSRKVRELTATVRQGRSLDDMVTQLQQDQQFNYIEDINDLLAALEDAGRQEGGRQAGVLPGTGDLYAVGVNPYETWWLTPQEIAEYEQAAERDAIEAPEAAAPADFDVTEYAQGPREELSPTTWTAEAWKGKKPSEMAWSFISAAWGTFGQQDMLDAVLDSTAKRAKSRAEQKVLIAEWIQRSQAELARVYAERETGQPAVDVLPTGEVQPRLPEAGAVREAEVPTPTLEAPFSLTPPTARGPRGRQTTLFQGAYHGSPHIFDQFSLQQIGTGEGAAAWGWGLYFSSQREIAEHYRRDLSPEPVPVFEALTAEENDTLPGWVRSQIAYSKADGTRRMLIDFRQRVAEDEEMLRPATAEDVAASKAAGWGTLYELGKPKDTQPWLLESRLPGLRRIVATLEKLYADGNYENVENRPGRTYKVEIPEDEDFLHWDLPASQQPAKIQRALRALGFPWEATPVPSVDDALQIFQSRRVQDLLRTDVGIREVLVEGYRYAEAGLERAFRAWFYRHGGLLMGTGEVDPTGEALYENLTSRQYRLPDSASPLVMMAAEKASRALAEQGVAGIKYLDGLSRTAGEGTYNYVVFDDRLVQITEFYQGRQRPAAGATIPSDDAYQVDLFNERVRDSSEPPESGGVPGQPVGVPPPGGEAGAGEARFATRTQLVTQRTRQLGASTILTPEDAATAVSYLARGAEEHFDALVTDAEGKPLGIVGSFKGKVDLSPIQASVIIGEVFAIPNAAAVWFIHNHPSGASALSVEDQQGISRLIDLFRGTDVAVKGGIAIGAGEEGNRQFQSVDPSGAIVGGTVRRAAKGARVAVLERELVAHRKLAARIAGPEDAVRVVPEVARGQFGAVLVDARHQPTAFVPVDPSAAAQLRTGGRLDALYRAISVGDPAGVFIYATPGTEDAALNLANAFHASDIRVLDIIGTGPVGVASARFVRGDFAFESRLTGQFEQARRGKIRFGPDRQFTIDLFAKADLSTFLHESGHFFFEVFADLVDQVKAADVATRTTEQRQMLADFNAILGFVGATDRAGVGDAQHEQFARAFEAYLMEGKAPSLTLRPAFARFRAWLLGIYRTLRGLNVQLTTQVRDVFDRLLAGEDALAAAEAQGVRRLFTTAADAGMTETEFSLYEAQLARAHDAAQEAVDRRLMVELQREREAAWTARRDEIEAEVTADVHAQPVYRALSAIQRGTFPNGEPLTEGMAAVPMRLSRQLLLERFGEERLRRLPPFAYTREGGVNPDVVAELFGFSSGDALVRALETADPMKALIRARTDDRMVREHGSLLLDGSIQETARAAVANEDRESVVRAELRALANLKRTVAPFVQAVRREATVAAAAAGRERAYERRWLDAEAALRVAIAEGRKQTEIDALRGEVNSLKAKARGGPAAIRAALPPRNAVRAVAQERVAKMRVRDIRPQQHWIEAGQASQRAVEAAARQDFDAAIAAKQQELLSSALYRESVTALDEVDQRVARAKDLARPKVRARLGLAGETYLDQIDGILDRFEFARVPAKVLERRASLLKWAAAIEGEGLPVDLPEELLDEARRVNYRDLTVEQLVGVTDGLDHIVHLARLKNRLLKAAGRRELAATVSEVATSIDEKARRQKKPREARDRRPADERKRAIESFFAAHRKISSYAYELDGFEEGGPFWEAVVRPLNEAGAKEAAMLADASKALHKIIDRAYPGAEKRTLYRRQEAPAIGRSFSKMERLMVALYWGNVEGRNRLLANEGWTLSQIQGLLDTLSPTDWRFVQELVDYVDTFWPAIVEKEKRVSGVEPKKVEALAVQTPYGEQRGGYFPLKYDERESAAAGALIDLEHGVAQAQAAYVRLTTRRGHTKERQARVNQRLRLRLDFGVAFEHVQQVVHDLSHHEALIDVGRVLGSAGVQDAIYGTLGDVAYKQFKDSLRDIAVGDVAAGGAVERAFTHLRTGATTAILGWSFVTSAFQVLGITQSVVRVGPKWIGRGLSRWVRDAATMENTSRWITERSEMMRTRFLTQQRDVRDALREVGVQSGKFSGWVDTLLAKTTFNTVTKQRLVESYFWAIQVMQRTVDIPTWLGAFEKARAEGREETDAIAIADQAVLDTQSGGQIKDLARVQRGGPMLKLWMTFGSFFNTTYNLAVESTRRTRWGKPKDVLRLGSDYLLLFIVPATLSYVLRQVIRGNAVDEDDESLVAGIIRENLGYMMGMLAGLRELSGIAQGFSGYEGPAGARLFASTGRAYVQVEQVAKEVAQTGEVGDTLDPAFWRSINEAAGVLFHYPATQIYRTVAGLSAWLEGKAPPVSVLGGPPREE